MPASFSLRIESGAQAGEIATLEGGGLSVGRRPGNDLVLQDPSVSGRHARLSIESDRLVVVDFGSTNGTFVAGAKVDEATLDPGSTIRFGKVEVSVHAGALEPAAPAPAVDPGPAAAMPAAAPPPAAPAPAPGDDLDLELELDEPVDEPADAAPAPAGGSIEDDLDDELHAIDAALLGRAKKGPGALPLLLGVGLVAGGCAWVALGMPGLGGGDEPTAAFKAVPRVAGNLLDDPSFEQDGLGGEAWEVDATAPAAPWLSDAWRDAGAQGLGADLEDGTFALVRSAPVRIPTARGFSAGAVARAEDAGRVALGVEFRDEQGEHPPVRAWAPTVDADGPGELELAVSAPPGYEQASLVLRAAAVGGPGAGAFDDAFLVAEAVAPLAQTAGFSVHDLADGRLAIGHLDRPLVLALGRDRAAAGSAATGTDEGLTLTLAGAGGLELVLDPGYLAQGLATLGVGGYRPHADAFEDAGVTSLVLGDGVHQLRLVLPAATTVTGQPLAAGYRLTATAVDGPVVLEQGFAEERALAKRLDDKARVAERDGDLAGALALWQQLLDEVPFERELVLGAEASRARLVAAGLAELDALRDDFERARFFGLPGLFDQCLVGVDAVARRYAGSEVEEVALALFAFLADEAAAAVGPEADDLAGARDAVLELIEGQGASQLADHLRRTPEGN